MVITYLNCCERKGDNRG